ncbi:MAG: hypothetical protein KAJ14_05185 [Candidatus Omnitrophica bacterium]|nr:hypothetical protein [Candidatus Omnitrophota bacterium]
MNTKKELKELLGGKVLKPKLYSFDQVRTFLVLQRKEILEEIDKAINQAHGGGNGKRLLIQLKEKIK